MSLHQIYISVGSNVDAKNNIEKSVFSLKESFSQVTLSPWYESVAIGFDGDNFINGVIGAKTDKSLQQVIDTLKDIEDIIGRDRRFGKYSAKIIDLDLLTFDEKVCNTPITLPRPEITENAFVLQPLSDIAPNEIHPPTQSTYQELWNQYPKSKQKLWQIEW